MAVDFEYFLMKAGGKIVRPRSGPSENHKQWQALSDVGKVPAGYRPDRSH